MNTLTVVTHLNLASLAERLLAEGYDTRDHNYVSAPPIQVAAQAGNVAMLRLLQDHLPSSNFEPWSVIGAAIRGDLDVCYLDKPG